MARHKHHLDGWLFAAPALLGLGLFLALPFLVAMVLAFTNERLGSPLPTRVVGFDNFAAILADPVFLRALLNNCYFAAVVVPLQTGLALLLASALNTPLRGMTVLRSCFFLPVVYPMALVAVIWQMLYAPGAIGLANQVLHTLSFGAWQPAVSEGVLQSPLLAMPAIMLLSIWQGLGFQTIILLAGLQAIPSQLYEAARIDRANAWQRFWHVTVPGLRNPLIFTGLVTTIFAFRLFDQVQILTDGGPEHATTTVIHQAWRAAFARQQIGLASAMTVVFFLIVCIIALSQHLLFKQERSAA
ncbi:MAG: carbohydrate ABC transporter permease [Planctomycetota bacterium]